MENFGFIKTESKENMQIVEARRMVAKVSDALDNHLRYIVCKTTETKTGGFPFIINTDNEILLGQHF